MSSSEAWSCSSSPSATKVYLDQVSEIMVRAHRWLVPGLFSLSNKHQRLGDPLSTELTASFKIWVKIKITPRDKTLIRRSAYQPGDPHLMLVRNGSTHNIHVGRLGSSSRTGFSGGQQQVRPDGCGSRHLE